MGAMLDRMRLPGYQGNFAYLLLLLIAAASIVAVFLLRLGSVLEFKGLLPTSGFEGPGAFGVYVRCTHSAIYQDFSQGPNIFNFNFIYYEFYGWLVRQFGACEQTTPFFGRLTTAAFAIGLSGAIFVVGKNRLHPFEALAIAAAPLSPYIGWWAFSLRPDVAAAALLAIGLSAAVSYVAKPRYSAVVVCALFVILSWGFKQTYLFVAPFIFLLILQRRAVHAVCFGALIAIGLCVPFAVYGVKPYFAHTFMESHAPFFVSFSIQNTESFVLKALPFLIVAVPAAMNGRKEKIEIEKKFLIVGILFSFVLTCFLAAKAGASDNYFFPTVVFLVLLTLRYLPDCKLLLRRAAMSMYAVISILLCAAILTGRAGRVELGRSEDLRRFQEVAGAINAMPSPKIVWDEVIALPWFTKDVDTRILWPVEASEGGARFGLEQRLGSSYYATVALPTSEQSHFNLSGYRLEATLGQMSVFRRRE